MTEKWGEIQGKWDFVRVIGVLPCIITTGRTIIKCNCIPRFIMNQLNYMTTFQLACFSTISRAPSKQHLSIESRLSLNVLEYNSFHNGLFNQ